MSIKKHYNEHIDLENRRATATKEAVDELKKAVGYRDNFWTSYMGLRRNTLTAPPVSVAERLEVIEARLGIEIVREPERVVAKEKTP